MPWQFMPKDSDRKQDFPTREKSDLPTKTPKGNRIMCAWCGSVIQEGPEPVSHGMCPDCFVRLYFEPPVDPEI
jgi:hypothetical protein